MEFPDKQACALQAVLMQLLQLVLLVMLLPMFLVQLPLLLATVTVFHIIRDTLGCLQAVIRGVRLLARCINITCQLVLLKMHAHRPQRQLLLMAAHLGQV